MKRAGIIGRGPIPADVELGPRHPGYPGGAPEDMVAWRQHALFGVEHDYHLQRAAADRVSPDLLGTIVAVQLTLQADAERRAFARADVTVDFPPTR